MEVSALDLVRAFICVISLFVEVVTQVLAFRLFGRKHLLRSQVVGFLGGSVAFAVLFFGVIGENSLGPILANAIGFVALAYGYFHFLNLGETARRVRIMREIADGPKEGLTLDEIVSRYSAKELIEKRLNRLLKTKQIVLRDGNYFIEDKTLLRISNLILLMKRIIIGKSLGFEKASPLERTTF